MAALDNAKCARRGLEVTVLHQGHSEIETNVLLLANFWMIYEKYGSCNEARHPEI